MVKLLYKSFPSEVLKSNDENLILEHFISTESQDDSGDIVRAAGMVIRGKPVVLKQHGMDAAQGQEPIAKPLSFHIGEHPISKAKGIIAETQYFPDEVGKRLYQKAKDGFMPNFSIGYQVIKSNPTANGGREVTEWSLHEYSQVAVGMNPEATALTYKSFEPVKLPIIFTFTESEPEIKGVISYAEHSKASLDTVWNGGKEVSAADVSDLKIMCTWFDESKPDVKSSYKLPHHTHDNYTTVWNGVKAAMGALLGARGGVQMPAGDKKGAYNHLVKHYKEFEKTPPDFKEYKQDELAKMGFFYERKSIQEQINGTIPSVALSVIFDGMRYEIYNMARSGQYTPEEIGNVILSELIDLLRPYIAQLASELEPPITENAIESKFENIISKLESLEQKIIAVPAPINNNQENSTQPPPAFGVSLKEEDRNLQLNFDSSKKDSVEINAESIKAILQIAITESMQDFKQQINKLKGRLD
jgi:hypothetical protein